MTPVVMPGGNGRVWLVTRYPEVRAALADPRLHKDWAGKLTEPGWVPDEVTGYLSVHLLNADPPDAHPAAQAGVEGVHRPPGSRAAASGRGDHRGAARRAASRPSPRARRST